MRILLVEDEPKILTLVARGLMADRVAVDLTLDGQSGLDLATTCYIPHVRSKVDGPFDAKLIRPVRDIGDTIGFGASS